MVISPGAILSRCNVVDRPAGSREALPSSPSKRKGVPTPQSRFWAVEDEEEGSKVDDDSETFFCRYAVDSRRGIFYKFAWQEHLSWCRAQQRTPLFGEDEPGPSSRVAEASSVWGDGSIWDVKEKKTADEEEVVEGEAGEETSGEADKGASRHTAATARCRLGIRGWRDRRRI